MQFITAQLQLFLLTYTSSLLPTLQIFPLQQAICNSYKNILKSTALLYRIQSDQPSSFKTQQKSQLIFSQMLHL